MPRVDLKVSGCSFIAAKHAVSSWHYSRSMPGATPVRFGVWEAGEFIGAVLFSRGATAGMLKPYGLTQTQGCELTRVALRDHVTPVSRIVSIAVRKLIVASPGLQLIVSYADPDQDHHGGIYQAMGWIYTGLCTTGAQYRIDGERVHSRTVHSQYATAAQAREVLGDRFEAFTSTRKHRYVRVLPAATAQLIEKIATICQPYPKRTKKQDCDLPSQLGGSIPSRPLQSEHVQTRT